MLFFNPSVGKTWVCVGFSADLRFASAGLVTVGGRKKIVSDVLEKKGSWSRCIEQAWRKSWKVSEFWKMTWSTRSFLFPKLRWSPSASPQEPAQNVADVGS